MQFRHLLFVLAACGSTPGGGVAGDDDPIHDGGGGSGDDGGGTGDDGGGVGDDGGTGGDGGTSDGGMTDGSTTTDGSTMTDGGTTSSTSQICETHAWNAAVPAAGNAIMAYGTKAYLFAADGLSWTVVENGAATVGAIPFPPGITAMKAVTVEIAPSGRPFVTFMNAGATQNQKHGAFFDGTGFVGTTLLGQVQTAHADASERIYAYGTNGLTEFAAGAQPIIRGAFPYTDNKGWTVAPDGTVYLLRAITRPSTIHPGDTANELRVIRLRHGVLSWTDEVAIGSNEGYGFSQVAFAAAPDGSLHVAYTPIGIYFRSQDGQTWATEQLISFNTAATMIDPAQPGIDGEAVSRVKGGVYHIAAQDYDHATVTLTYNGGSFSVPSYYFLRRCPPFNPTFPAWPAERLAMSGTAFGPTPVAVNEHGVPAIHTPFGVRQDVHQ